MDVIPDAIPLLGVLDDAAVVSACLALLEQDLYDYREWLREETDREVDTPVEETTARSDGNPDKTAQDPSDE
jgi:uncharacterized membrane protein YkvA (DUF1232 family)